MSGSIYAYLVEYVQYH